MKFGVRLLDDVGGPEELVALAVRAEELGFDAIWFPHDAFRLHSWVLTSATAQATKRVQLYARTNLYTSDPSEIAAYVATLDALSNGRANVSIGLHTVQMLKWLGIDGSDVLQRTRETVEILRSLFRGEKTPYQGKNFHWTDNCFLRVPPLRPDVPIYVCPYGGQFGERFLELSGELGDGSLPMITPPESAKVMTAPVWRGVEEAGRSRSNFDMVGFVWISVSEDGSGTAELMRDVAAYFGAYLDEPALNTIGLSQGDFFPLRDLIQSGRKDEALQMVRPDMLRLGITGTPDDCIRQLGLLADAGVTQVSLGGPLGPDPKAALELIARRILPAFR
ncbi:MAG: LLM class flavin-dependent oxidoreductase [Chloroflexi bacterium]|nr:LLM class flavin-dependent oxidoreductase [Chloroflexota bacterium]